MSNILLTEGVLAKIMQGDQVENSVVQILCCKKIQGGDGDNNHYRLLLSDSKYMYSFVTLASQLNHQVEAGQISNNTIITIKRYITTIIQAANKDENQRVLVILDLEILARGKDVGMKIGKPRNLTAKTVSVESSSSTTATETNEIVITPNNETVITPNNETVITPNNETVITPNNETVITPQNNNFLGNNSNANTSAASNASFSKRIWHPIESISPYRIKWVLKVRVMNKGPIRTWSNCKGTGKLFSMDLCDKTGEIRATAFWNEVDRFYDMIQVDKVYYISGGKVKLANKQYSPLNNDYEITLSHDTQISECTEETDSVPTLSFRFIPIAELATMESSSVFDVIGVCKESTKLMCFQSRAGRQLKKREVTLVDQSAASINLALWASEAEEFDGSTHPIIAIKGGQLRDFRGGISISMGVGSSMRINPNIPEAHELRGWFDSQVDNLETINLSIPSDNNTNVPVMSIHLSQCQELRHNEKFDFILLGTVLPIKGKKCVYMSCPQEHCNKKVIDMNDNTYKCDKCDRIYDSFKYQAIMNVEIADHQDSVWATVFGTEAEKILGKTAQEMGEWLRDDQKAAIKYISKRKYLQYMFKCRVRADTYLDRPLLTTFVLAVEPFNYKILHKHYSEQIALLTGVQASV